MIKTVKPIFFDLFCGAGGLSAGLCEAGLQIGAAVENDPIATSTYEMNIGKKVLCKDIREVSGNELLKFSSVNKGELFLLAGCPPCQGFSQIRNRGEGANDSRNFLVFEFVRLVKEVEPLFILMENVPGINRKTGKPILDSAINELTKSYYIHFDIVNAADYGIPQIRKRFVLHGIRLDLYKNHFKSNKFGLPQKTHSENPQTDNLLPWTTVNVIKDLPQIKAGDNFAQGSIKNHIACKMSDLNLKRIRYVHEHGYLSDDLRPPCHSKKHISYTDVYNVMSWDKPAPTITGGCLRFSKGRYGHPEQDRALSPREAARLQTFKDNFIFNGSIVHISKQIGNAVPPLLARKSGEYFIKCWNQIETDLS